MRYYKDQYTVVDEEDIELGTAYGNYIVTVSVETMVFPGRISRKKYITIFELEDEDEEKSFWGKLRDLFGTNHPILPRTLVPDEIQMDDAIHDWIINWELPKHQIEKARVAGKKLRINYDKELEDRTRKAKNKILRYDEPTITHYQYRDIDLDRTFSKNKYKRGMHPHSQAQLKQNQKTS
ncbi:hypothetical protein [Shimazuella kribbensis]|uniref:hypothetical protein n=1 Tax=Shimazuella kribbensis TaxID=139808 RepID=UPI0003FDF2CC|nr:hypothetical protein [Shimazuella kribbensis]